MKSQKIFESKNQMMKFILVRLILQTFAGYIRNRSRGYKLNGNQKGHSKLTVAVSGKERILETEHRRTDRS